jgi:glutathione S-transferase
MSDEIILHHYVSSPFSEKVRVALGIKQLAWRAVEQPVIMPKPDLIPLTGGSQNPCAADRRGHLLRHADHLAGA